MDPDLRHLRDLAVAFTAFLAGELTSDELYEPVGEIRERKLARLNREKEK